MGKKNYIKLKIEHFKGAQLKFFNIILGILNGKGLIKIKL